MTEPTGGRLDGAGHGWTAETLRVHILDLLQEADKRNNERFIALRSEMTSANNAAKDAVAAALTAQKEAVAAALSAAEKAVGVAEVNAEKWRDNANEWRGSMNDRESRFAQADLVDARFAAVTEKIDALSGFMAAQQGARTGTLDARALLFGVLGIVVIVVAALSPHIH